MLRFQSSILWQLPSRPLLQDRPNGFIYKPSADVHVLMTTKIRGQPRSVMRAAHAVWAIRKEIKEQQKEDPQHAWVSHVQMCIFSSHLANICTWFGMPTVPYWLPAVTQEDGKMEDREGEGVRGEIKGVAMMWGHEPRGSLSFLFLICLSDDNKKKNTAAQKKRGRHHREKEKTTLKEKEARRRAWCGREIWLTIFHVDGKVAKYAGHNTVIPNTLVQMSAP